VVQPKTTSTPGQLGEATEPTRGGGRRGGRKAARVARAVRSTTGPPYSSRRTDLLAGRGGRRSTRRRRAGPVQGRPNRRDRQPLRVIEFLRSTPLRAARPGCWHEQRSRAGPLETGGDRPLEASSCHNAVHFTRSPPTCRPRARCWATVVIWKPSETAASATNECGGWRRPACRRASFNWSTGSGQAVSRVDRRLPHRD